MIRTVTLKAERMLHNSGKGKSAALSPVQISESFFIVKKMNYFKHELLIPEYCFYPEVEGTDIHAACGLLQEDMKHVKIIPDQVLAAKSLKLEYIFINIAISSFDPVSFNAD